MSDIRKIYSDFWNSYQKVMKGEAACHCYPSGDIYLEQINVVGAMHRYQLREPIVLRGLPCDAEGDLDAIIDCDEYFNPRAPGKPVRASIAVHYYLRKVNNRHQAELLYSLRFDYHPGEGGAEGDPIMHVHLDMSGTSR